MTANRQNKIIIIDDDREWCQVLGEMTSILGYNADKAHTLEEAQLRITEAEEKNVPYAIAILDMNFETGKSNIEVSRGKEILKYIKGHYPHIACIMISGAGKDFDEILDLRDDYDLDYYLGKERVEIDKLSKALLKAKQRTNPLKNRARRQKILQDSLEKWDSTKIILTSNLGEARIRKAKEGLQVSIRTLNEIKEYETELLEVEERIIAIKKELEALTGIN